MNKTPNTTRYNNNCCTTECELCTDLINKKIKEKIIIIANESKFNLIY